MSAHALAAQGQVWIVDDDGGSGVDFTTIQSAIAAASEGDTLLVRTGVYEPETFGSFVVLIQGKALNIVADDGARVVIRDNQISRSLLISGLSADQQVVLRGLEFDLVQELPSLAPLVIGNAGSVRMEDCTFRSASFFVDDSLLHVTDCESVVLSDCLIEARQYTFPSLLVNDSNVACFNTAISTLRDVKGLVLQGNGGAAVQASNSRLYLSSCTLTGGFGADELSLSNECGSGGDALIVTDCDVVLEDTLLVPGLPGSGSTPQCADGSPGEALRQNGGTLTYLDAAPPRIDVSSPARQNAKLRIVFDAPDTLAFALVSADPVQTPWLPFGELLVESPAVVSFAGSVAATGKIVFLPVGSPSFGSEADLLHVQGAVLDPIAGTVRLTNSSAVTLLAGGI